MKSFFKQILAYTLALLMCLSTVGFVNAESTAKVISATEKTTILTNEFDTLYGGYENHDGAGSYGFCTNSFAETVIDVEEEGYYQMDVNSLVRAGKSISFDVYIDEDVVNSFTVWGDGAAFDDEVCDLYLNKGQQVLKIAYTGGGSYHYLRSISLTKKATDSKAIWVNAVDVYDTAAYTQVAHNMYYTSAGKPIGYKINVPEGEAGLYQMYIKTARVDGDITNYDVKVNGTAVTSAKGKIPTNNAQTGSVWAVAQQIVPMCYVNLSEGENTIEFTNNGAFMYFARLKFDKAVIGENVTLVNGAGSTEVSFDKASLSGVGYVSDNGNQYKFTNGASLSVDVNVEKAGVYTMDVNVLTRDQAKNTWNVYIDGVLEGTYYTWLGGIWYEGEALDLEFKTAGLHTIKIETPNANAYMNEITLTKKARDEKAQWILGSTATGTGSVTWEKYQIDNGGNVQEYAEYKVNVASAGVYSITSQTTYNTVDITSAVLTVNGEEIGAVTVAGGERGSYGDEKVTTLLGNVYLTEGENTIKITNKDLPNGQTMMITRLKVDKVADATVVSETEATEVSLDNATLKDIEVNHNGTGNYKYGNGAYTESVVYVTKPGVYTMNAKILTRDQHKNTWNVYVDGALEGTYYTWLGNIWYEGEAIDINFATAGVHTIKIETPNANAYMNGFTLTKKARDEKAQWILGSTATGTGSATWEKYQLDNGGNVQEYAEYKVNAESAGTYAITMQSTYNTSDITSAVLTVNGKEIGAVTVAGGQRGSYGDEKVTTLLGEATLYEGVNIIRITNKDLPNGQTMMITRVKVDKVSDEISGNIKLHMRDYVKAYSPSNTADVNALGQEGANPDNTFFREGDWAEYSINIEKAGVYDLGLCFGAANAQVIKAYVDGKEVLAANYDGVSGSYARQDVVLGQVNFYKEGTYTLKLHKTSGSFAYSSHVFLNYVGELERNIRMHIRDYDAAYAPGSNQGSTSILGQDGANPDNTLLKENDWAEYTINVVAAGKYDLGLCFGAANAQIVKAYLNDEVVLTGNYAGVSGSYAKQDVVLGTINIFEPGTYKLKIHKTSGGFAYASHVFLNYAGEVTADLRFHIRDYDAAYAPQSNQGSTSILGQDGSNPDNTLWRENDWAEYTIDIIRPGVYDFGMCYGANAAQTVKVYIDGNDVLTAGYAGGGDYSKKDVVLGKINFLEKGTFKLKVQKTSGAFAYASHIFLNYAGEIVRTDISSVDTTEILAKDYSAGYDISKNTSQMTVEGGNISFGHGGDYVEYYINVERTGLYKLAVTTGCETTAAPIFDVSVDGDFQTRMTGTNKGWSTFEATDGYVVLEEGKHTLRLTNSGHPDFYLCKLAFSWVSTVANVNNTEAATLAMSGTKRAGAVSAFAINAPADGIYKLTMNVRPMQATVMNVYSQDDLLSIKNFAVSAVATTVNDFVRLNEGLNIVKCEIASGMIIFSGANIELQTAADKADLDEVIKLASKANNQKELLDIINDNEDVLGVDFADITSDIQYNEYVLVRLLNKTYANAVDFFKSLYNAVEAETKAPTVKTTLTDGTLTVEARTDIFTEDGTFIVAVYNGNRMIATNYVPFTVGEVKTLTVPNCSEDYAVKFFGFNSIDKMAPISLVNGVYEHIYVSPSGSADGDGSEENPYATIAQAKERVAELQSSMTGDIVVNIEPGYYELLETEIFTEEHGGRGEYKVIYRGTDANNASIIGGGKKVTGWTSVGNGIYSADFNGSDVRDLYVNGYPAVRARSEMFNATSRDGKTLVAQIGNYTFSNPSDLVLVWFNEWANHYTSVEDMSKSGTTATFTLSDVANFSTGTGVIDIYTGETGTAGWCDWHGEYHNEFYIENALELLDEEGEFYYDAAAGKIYYKPYAEENINTAEIFASQIDSLIKVTGTDNNSKVNNIVFENLGFRYSSWNNNDLLAIQATQYVSDCSNGVRTYSEIPSQITFDYVNNAVIKDCEFTCLGSNALALHDSVTNSKVSGNIFRDLAGGAIVVGTYNHEHRESIACQNIEISDNAITRTSLTWRSMPALTAYYERNIDIVRNVIKDVPYSGISLGWGWGNSTAKFGNFNVSNNRIENVMQVLTDGGHIYTLGDMPGTVISNNYFYKSPDGRGGVYNDSGSGNIDILNNVVDVYKNATSYWWFQGVYKTHDLHAEGNFAHSKLGVQDRASGVNNTNVNNVNMVENGTWDGKGNTVAQAIVDGAGLGNDFSSLLSEAALPAWRTNPLLLP